MNIQDSVSLVVTQYDSRKPLKVENVVKNIRELVSQKDTNLNKEGSYFLTHLINNQKKIALFNAPSSEGALSTSEAKSIINSIEYGTFIAIPKICLSITENAKTKVMECYTKVQKNFDEYNLPKIVKIVQTALNKDVGKILNEFMTYKSNAQKKHETLSNTMNELKNNGGNNIDSTINFCRNIKHLLGDLISMSKGQVSNISNYVEKLNAIIP